MSDQEKQEIEAKGYELQEREFRAMQSKVNREQGIAPAGDPMAAYRRATIERVAPDILALQGSRPQVVAWGIARFNQLAVEGATDYEQAVTIAAEETRRKFNMPSRNGSDTRDRVRPSVNRGAGVPAGNGSPGGREPVRVKMTNDDMKIAEAWARRKGLDHLTKQEQHIKWAKATYSTEDED
jgi:hypothetical protein